MYRSILSLRLQLTLNELLTLQSIAWLPLPQQLFLVLFQLNHAFLLQHQKSSWTNNKTNNIMIAISLLYQNSQEHCSIVSRNHILQLPLQLRRFDDNENPNIVKTASLYWICPLNVTRSEMQWAISRFVQIPCGSAQICVVPSFQYVKHCEIYDRGCFHLTPEACSDMEIHMFVSLCVFVFSMHICRICYRICCEFVFQSKNIID